MTTVKTKPFGVLPCGREARLIEMTNGKGWTVTLTDLGAGIRSIVVPDKNGALTDVALCHGSFDDSLTNEGYLGATCGRVANRIKDGKFSLGGKTYVLEKTHPGFILHGGKVGFSHMLWETEITEDGAVVFTLRSPDGDQGFPGNLDVTATYTWDDEGRLGVDYKAVTDADTIVNLTNHVYFNLNGHGSGSVEGHTVQLDCDFFLPIGPGALTTGEVFKVKDTVMDFTSPQKIGLHLKDDDEILKNGLGYDASFVLRQGEGVRRCARVTGPETGIVLEAFTDYPAVHLYTGNNIKEYTGKDGAVYGQYGGFCLETQLFPDFISCPAYQKHILKPGEVYHYHTDYVFSAE